MSAKKTGATVALGTAAAIAFAAPSTMKWEGIWLTAKVDKIGTGQPVTYCYGQTDEFGKVKIGTKFTLEQCKQMLLASLPKYNAGISPCITVPISDLTRAAFIMASYNAGVAAFCKSSVLKLMNAGKGEEACEALKSWYVRARGVVVRGLQNRRRDESAMCMAGLKEPKIGPDGKPIDAPKSRFAWIWK
ncbi:lysozyme [Bradyrhizobium neotropicale]|uniref:lysozyme n=1 Tax=Bradyrhizobium neotropicale TaxID=1497615 RepID=UPI001AD72779|nr:lysozyme [Bradyrhizobium neotropicale]MBO4228004.1 glycoside hydrolase family protein [Bradyrhizobium neotropicale]